MRPWGCGRSPCLPAESPARNTSCDAVEWASSTPDRYSESYDNKNNNDKKKKELLTK